MERWRLSDVLPKGKIRWWEIGISGRNFSKGRRLCYAIRVNVATLCVANSKIMNVFRAGALRVEIAEGPLLVREEALVVGVPLLFDRYGGHALVVLGGSRSH